MFSSYCLETFFRWCHLVPIFKIDLPFMVTNPHTKLEVDRSSYHPEMYCGWTDGHAIPIGGLVARNPAKNVLYGEMIPNVWLLIMSRSFQSLWGPLNLEKNKDKINWITSLRSRTATQNWVQKYWIWYDHSKWMTDNLPTHTHLLRAPQINVF